MSVNNNVCNKLVIINNEMELLKLKHIVITATLNSNERKTEKDRQPSGKNNRPI